MDSIDLSRKLLEEARVLIFPGTGFGEQWVDYMRVSYLAPEAGAGRGDVARRGVPRSARRDGGAA